jgi:hypothetical protein
MVLLVLKARIILRRECGTMSRKDHELTNEDIGLPQDFRHLTHIGWDPNTGFNMHNVADDPQLQQFFDNAGVKDCQQQDPEMRELIYDVIMPNEGRQVNFSTSLAY